MPDAMPYERVLPCLLDRLTDEEPGVAKESRDRRLVTVRRYLEGVRRDLSWLLNSNARGQGDPIEEYPEASRSVLNFGIPDLCGVTGSGVETAELERQLRHALQVFEPRLVRSTLFVRVVTHEDQMNANAMAFEISGELFSQPAPESFYVKTEVDLETGEWHF